MIWNETVNAARLGLRAAIQSVQDFDASRTDQQALTLLVTVADIEGVPRKPWREFTERDARKNDAGFKIS